MSKSRRFVLWVVAALLTVAAAYVMGMQIADYVHGQRKAERRAKAVESTRAVLDYMQTIEVGDEIPDVTLEDIDGQRHRLSDLVDGRAIISYVQTDCEACLLEMEQIAASCHDSADWRRFVLISSANPLHLLKLRDNLGLRCRILFDEERYFGEPLGISTFPFSLVVNDSLRILEVYGGGIPEEEYARGGASSGDR